LNSVSTTNGYDIYGSVYQPLSAGSTVPNSNGYFPAIEALSPVSLEFEGANGILGQFPNGCFPSSAYNDGLASAAVSDVSAGIGVPTIINCTTSARCAGGNGDSLSGQKLIGLTTGLRQHLQRHACRRSKAVHTGVTRSEPVRSGNAPIRRDIGEGAYFPCTALPSWS